MITVVCVYYESQHVPSWSRCYHPGWVDALYRGVRRHYSQPFQFVCLTDKPYSFKEPVMQLPLAHTKWETALLQAFAVEADRLVFMGLDTVIVGNVDHIFAYDGALAVPRDPYVPQRACSGVVLCPTRHDIAQAPGANDMVAIDQFPHDWLDDLYPGQILSYKVHVRDHGLGDARIVYMHGTPKAHELQHLDWIKEHWHAQ